MRFIQIIFFLILFSCSNNNADTAAAVPELKPDQQEKVDYSSADVDMMMEPVMGGPLEIEIKVNNAISGKSYLINSVAGGNFRVDSTMIENGVLKYKNDEGMPQGLYFATLPNEVFIQMFLGEDQKFSLECDMNNIVQTMKVKGSKENELYYTNLKYEEEYSIKYQPLAQQMNAIADKESAQYKQLDTQKRALEAEREKHLEQLFKGNDDLLFVKFKIAGQNPKVRETGTGDEKVYFYRKEFWDNVDFSDTRLLRTPVITNKLKRYIKDITPQSPDSINHYSSELIKKVLPYPQYFKLIANWIALEYEPGKTTLMDAEAVFVYMIQNYFTRDLAFWSDSMEVYALQQRAGEMAQSLVGLKGPNVISTDPDGKTKSIYELKEDYIVVYMYNPTCEHCMKETPELVKWYNRNRNNSVAVYAIAIDTDETEWKNYVKEKNMSVFTNVFDPTNKSIYAKYFVNVTPELYLLNKDRTIIAKNLKVFQIDEMIQRDKG